MLFKAVVFTARVRCRVHMRTSIRTPRAVARPTPQARPCASPPTSARDLLHFHRFLRMLWAVPPLHPLHPSRTISLSRFSPHAVPPRHSLHRSRTTSLVLLVHLAHARSNLASHPPLGDQSSPPVARHTASGACAAMSTANTPAFTTPLLRWCLDPCFVLPRSGLT